MKLVIAITGASGSRYALDIIKTLSQYKEVELSVIFTDTAKEIWEAEVSGSKLPSNVSTLANNNFYVPFASGSNPADAMLILPCSMGTMGRIASGLSSNLIERIADVQLKERKKLVMVPREAPLSLIHINNMKTLAQAGAIILPASPTFYNNPKSLEELIHHFSLRAISTLGIEPKESQHKWI